MGRRFPTSGDLATDRDGDGTSACDDDAASPGPLKIDSGAAWAAGLSPQVWPGAKAPELLPELRPAVPKPIGPLWGSAYAPPKRDDASPKRVWAGEVVALPPPKLKIGDSAYSYIYIYIYISIYLYIYIYACIYIYIYICIIMIIIITIMMMIIIIIIILIIVIIIVR